MTDQIQNPNIETSSQIPVAPPPETPRETLTGWMLLFSKIKPALITIPGKFYSNKKIFWPVSVALGLVLLIILLGLIFGKRNIGPNTPKLPSPTPTVQITPEASVSGDILINSQSKLNDLKKQINNLDVKQSHFQPPKLDFDIKL